ncbi:MAG: bifunctional 5,10-methylenetetrahydrofolate dehydrogenase/5,10-methenyltetrahydrofolate cyclohydrolase [Firmicutes bacterium]|nr:bifunctional 5,10-methylenetetrahydrofolate dehydrogenase/5,10-methenyltetrahydrofolate cyclohydrolase [Bacillota bacterium]
MATILLDGKALAANMMALQKKRVQNLSFAIGRAVGIGVVLVGDDPASKAYVRKKLEACYSTGIVCAERHMRNDVTQAELVEVIQRLNATSNVDAILVQLPLPKHINERDVLAMIRPDKDVDGLSTVNAGLLSQRLMGTRPCTPLGVMMLLEQYQIQLQGKHAVVVGDSNLVGRPMALMLLNMGATVTVCHKHTTQLKEKTKEADILIVAAGQVGLIGAGFVKKGAVVIDIGFNHINGRCFGDVDFDSVAKIAGAITPVPGGVGPMTVSALIENTLVLAERRTISRMSSTKRMG